MKDRMCLSKKIVYTVFFGSFVFLFVLLSQLILQSNQAKNSRAADTNEVALIPQANPPTLDQQNSSNMYKVSLDNSGYIELLGTPPTVEEGKLYSIYLKRGKSFVHIDTFKASSDSISKKFSYWDPKVKVTGDDIQNGIFYFFQVN